MNEGLLAFQEVHYTSPGAATTLSGLSFSLGRGEFFAVLGAEASARQAVALLAAGLARPERGRVLIGGGPAGAREPDAAPRRAGLVFSAPGQGLIAATVREEVEIGLAWRGCEPKEAEARAEELLRQFALWELRARQPSTLSGGEKQRLAMAAALAAEPACLVLDEPTAMLDPVSAGTVVDAARDFARQGGGVLWLAGGMARGLPADQIALLHGGGIVWQGTPGALLRLGAGVEGWGLEPAPLVRLSAALGSLGLDLSFTHDSPGTLVEEICSVWTGSA